MVALLHLLWPESFFACLFVFIFLNISINIFVNSFSDICFLWCYLGGLSEMLAYIPLSLHRTFSEINWVSHLYGLGALFQALICLNFMCSDFHFSDHNKWDFYCSCSECHKKHWFHGTSFGNTFHEWRFAGYIIKPEVSQS